MVGLSYEGYEAQMMELFTAIEANRKASNVASSSEVLAKTNTKGKRELQRLECFINYDAKRGLAFGKVRGIHMFNEA